MKKVLFFFLLSSTQVFSQNRGNIWCFGDSAGIDFNQPGNTIPFESVVHNRGSCVTICDSSGNLLFYSSTESGIIGNTTKVWTKNNLLMQNGDSIVGQGWYFELSIVPNPADDHSYYLFSLGITNSGNTGLYYSIIDMSLNNGLGAVIQKNIQLQSFPCDDGSAAIKHGNGRDWWYFFRKNSAPNDTIYSYMISPSGISSLITQKIGGINNGYIKRLIPSHDGLQLAVTNFAGLIEIFDFDRCSGNFTFNKHISDEFQTPEIACAEFSPNNQLLYVVTEDLDSSFVLQFDLTESDPFLTHDTINTFVAPPSPAATGWLKLGPDNKIYVTHGYYNAQQNYFPYADSMYNQFNMNLSVIENPDVVGGGCNFNLYSFYLGGARSYNGLPNNPNYDLPALQNSICDTITSVNAVEQTKPKLNVFYHTDWKKLFVNASGLKDGEYHLAIYTIDGKTIFSSPASSLNGFLTKDIAAEGFSSSTYIVVLENGKVKLTEKFIAN